MDEQRQDNQLDSIYNSSVPIQDIALKTSREQWTIETGGKRGSGRSVLAVRHDVDDISHYEEYDPQELNISIMSENQPFSKIIFAWSTSLWLIVMNNQLLTKFQSSFSSNFFVLV